MRWRIRSAEHIRHTLTIASRKEGELEREPPWLRLRITNLVGGEEGGEEAMNYQWLTEETNQKFGSWYPVKLDYAARKEQLDPITLAEIHRYALEADRLRQHIHRLLHKKSTALKRC